MTDALSTSASVVAVLGAAVSTVRVLTTFIHEFAAARDDIRQSLKALESLRLTLTGLHECSIRLGARYQFSPHFPQSVAHCEDQLRVLTEKLASSDSEFVKRQSRSTGSWNRKVRRFKERTKWVVIGNSDMKKLFEILELYQFQFSVELLKLQMHMCDALSSASAAPLAQPLSAGAPRSQLGSALASYTDAVIPQTPSKQSKVLFESYSNNAGIYTPQANLSEGTSRPLSPLFPHYNRYQWIRSSVLVCLSYSAEYLALQVGPVLEPSYCSDSKAQSSKRHNQIGLGIGISFSLSRWYRRRITMSLRLIQVANARETYLSLRWTFDFPRIVCRDAEIFQYVRRAATSDIKSLFSTGRASAKDCSAAGTSLLHTAANMGNPELVRLLIREGADVNSFDEDGETPLHAAIFTPACNVDTARLLIENGADLSNKSIDGRTPLHALFNATLAAVLQMENYLEDVSPTRSSVSITHAVAWSSSSTVADFQRARMYDTADIWLADDNGRTCLHKAADRGNLEILSFLLERAPGSEVRKRDKMGRTLLHYAVQSSRAEQVIGLIAPYRIDVSLPDVWGQTALHRAAARVNLLAVRKVVSLCTNASNLSLLLSPDKNGKYPSQIAYHGGYKHKRLDAYSYLRDLEATIQKNKTSEDQAPEKKRNEVKKGAKAAVFRILTEFLVVALIFYTATNAY